MSAARGISTVFITAVTDCTSILCIQMYKQHTHCEHDEQRTQNILKSRTWHKARHNNKERDNPSINQQASKQAATV
jgi:hypothetical protein